MKKFKLVDPSRIDYLLVVSVLFLVIFGAAMVYSASSYWAETHKHNSAYCFWHQLAMACIGFVLMFIIANIDYHWWLKQSITIYIACVVVLLLVLSKIPVITVVENHQTRSLCIGPFKLQPSVFACYGLIVFLAFSLAQNRDHVSKFWGHFVKFGALALAIIIPVSLQRDMGTAVVISLTVYGLFFIAKFPLQFLLPSGGVVAAAGYFLIKTSTSQREILTTFWNYWIHDQPLGMKLWQAEQSLMGMASGGMFGVGIGNSRFRFAWLPEAHKDFIFSIICEEIGWIGAVCLLALFFLILYRGMKIASQAPDLQGQLLACGITAFIMTYALINTSVAMVLVPTTGIPMPFLSYGGSTLVAHLAALGLLVNISSQASASYTHYSDREIYSQNLERPPFSQLNRRSTTQFVPSDNKVRMLH
jgi:cell division protein FtsW